MADSEALIAAAVARVSEDLEFLVARGVIPGFVMRAFLSDIELRLAALPSSARICRDSGCNEDCLIDSEDDNADSSVVGTDQISGNSLGAI
ncbi:hypothetical protein VTK73DRAFT_2503 [Phialemonium thermophilum]|uniref:Uncharacterized protein n=1 Tax=Phialemonium thermophilum TaxID=223376 RepID=A0ABR3Y2X6_9PEZI